jgi:GNAT superfamily N-acetyltransferase
VPQVSLRPARADDLAALVEIELAAGVAFRGLGMDAVADDDPGSVEDLTSYAEDGRAFVAANAADRPIGYLLLDLVDGAAHIEQVTVHPNHARQRIGRALIERAELWARSHGLDALTLTTYSEVPWNGPYYERLGFAYLTSEQVTPELRSIREHERQRGLDQWPRACMRLSL